MAPVPFPNGFFPKEIVDPKKLGIPNKQLTGGIHIGCLHFYIFIKYLEIVT
jgi:hypothetical protein